MDGKLLAAALLTLGLISEPAAAQVEPLAATSKAEAILGGPSKPAALIAQQSGEAKIGAVPEPAGRGLARVENSAPAFRPAVAGDRPDVFGTTALRVRQTPLDDRWLRVRNASVKGALASWAGELAGRPLEQRIHAINRYVNGRVAFTDDIRQFRRADRWQSASETLRRGRGDCEDYAIAKLQLLRAAGVSPSDLYLVIVKDLVRRADHAVLVVRANGKMMLLDNATDRVADATAYQDYRPVLSYAAAGRAWTHGYQRAPLDVAAAPATVSLAASASAALR